MATKKKAKPAKGAFTGVIFAESTPDQKIPRIEATTPEEKIFVLEFALNLAMKMHAQPDEALKKYNAQLLRQNQQLRQAIAERDQRILELTAF